VTIEDADTCDRVGDVLIAKVQTLLDEAAEYDLLEMSGPSLSEALADFESDRLLIQDKLNQLGCSANEVKMIVSERAASLRVEDGTAAALILEGFLWGLGSGEILNLER